MKNLKLREKVAEVLDKSALKKAAAYGTALMLAVTPVMSSVHAESNAGTKETQSSADILAGLLGKNEEKAEERQQYQMTLEDFENGATAAYQELTKYIDYEHMIEDVLAAYYFTNYEYISDELTEQLIEKGYIADTDMFDPDGKPEMDRSGWENINHYNRLVNSINDYNEGKIQREYNEGKKSPKEEYIDASLLCAEAYDRQDMHEIFEKWYDEYDLTKGTIKSNEAHTAAHKHLTHLNSEEKDSQLYDASIGARFTELKVYGNEVMDFETDYLDENYKYKDLEKYFKAEELRKGQWVLRDDFEKQECPDEIYFVVRWYGELHYFARDTVNKELFTLMRTKELARESTTEKVNKK